MLLRSSLSLPCAVLWLLVAAGIAVSAHAQTTFIKADNTSDLNTAPSYTANSSVPGAADTIQIDSTLTAVRTALLGGSFSINGITVPTSYAQRFTFGSTTGATLTIGAGGIAKANTSVAMNLGCSVALGANQTWNIAGNNLVFNGPTPIISTNGYNLVVTGNGTFDLRPTTAFTCGSNVTINCAQVNINAAAADVTFGGANTFKNLLIATGTAEGSTFPADANAATSSHFGNASSGTITFGANTATAGALIYNGNTASTPKTFTYDARNTGTATIKVSTAGQTLTLTSTLLLSNGATQTSDKSWIFGGAGNLTLNGPVANATGSSFKIGLTKNDAGTLTLKGANTYTGDTIINGGTLAVSGSGTLSGTTNVVVAGGATLDVSGMSSALVIGAGKTLSNSASATGTLKGNINASGGKLALTFNGTAPAFSIGSGTLTLSSSSVVQIGGAFDVGTYHLITTTAGGSVAGTLPSVSLFRGAIGHLQLSASGLDLVVDSADPFHYYIAPTGNDTTGDGTPGTPWQSITKVRDYLRTIGPLTSDITVYLRGGRHEIASTLSFTTADSGTNGHYITYQSYPGERATISGGKRVTGWTQVPGQAYWVASVPTSSGFADYFRTMFVNGVRAERARSNWITGSAYFDDPATTTQTVDGIAFATTAGLKTYTNVTDIRLVHAKYFKIDECPILGIATDSGTGLINVQLQQPYCQYRYDYGGGYFDAASPWMVVNAFEELDEPGEFYLNRSTQQVYYYPNPTDDMTTALVYAPVVEKLVDVSGDSSTSKVQNLRFQGINFEHSNWLFPRDYFVGGASGNVLLKAAPPTGSTYYAYEVPGAIKVTNAIGIQFIGNTIQRQSTCGIHLFEGVDDTLIQGNTFVDLSGAAVLHGRAYPYTDICTNTTVADNVMRHTGADFWGGSMVESLGGYGFKLLRNDMADCAYSGFNQSNGFSTLAENNGQGATEVGWNRVTLAQTAARYGVGDGASLYTYGVFPNTLIHDNDVSDILEFGDISNNVHGLYQDNGSYGITWQNNVVRDVTGGIWGCFWVRKDIVDANVNKAINTYSDASTFVVSGLASNTGYTPFTLGTTPPAAAQTIIQAAGLGSSYTGLLSRIYSGTNLARGKTTSSTSTSGYSSGAAVDWNIRTPWHSSGSDTNASWSVDLGSAYVLQRVEIVARIDQNDSVARSAFQVQGSNSAAFATFTVLAEQSSVPFAYKQTNLRNSWIKYLNNPNGYRYLRVKKTNTAGLGIEEFRAFGYAVPTTPGQLVWDASATGSITDGSGPWNAPDQWWNGSANQAWVDNNDVVIGNSSGTAGTITVTGASPQVNSLTFNAATSGNYILSGAALQLNGSSSSNTITANANATVNNNITTAGAFIKAGNATLVLAGTNTFAGDLTVNAGTLSLSTATLPATSTVTLSTGVVLNLNFTGTKSITTLRIHGLTQAPGTWGSLTSTATNKTSLITGTGLLNITGTQPPYDAWAIASGLDNSTLAKDASTTADPDHDGVSNLMEYATKMNGAINDAVPMSAAKSSSGLDFIYRRNKSATDVTCIVEWSDDLVSWSSTDVSAPTTLNDNGITQQIRVAVPAGSGVTRRFVHMKVTQP